MKLNRNISALDLHPMFVDAILPLPFDSDLADWSARGVQTLTMRRGESRHEVLFVRSLKHQFAVKQTTLPLAQKELRNYHKLLALGIKTLQPVGIVVRTDEPIEIATPAGMMYEKNDTAFLITRLEEAVLPESILFSFGFQRKAKLEIFDAIADLFAKCHARGVYWGDASLENVLIKFQREEHTLGKQRRLVAVLSDAETTEIHPSLSERAKEADIEFFFESMLWLDEEFRRRGLPRDRAITDADIEYIYDRYVWLSDIWNAHRALDAATGIDSEKLFGRFRHARHAQLLQKHLEEHKWYLSENARREVPMSDAVEDWYVKYFLPLQDTFSKDEIARLFPDKTELELYIEMMAHKYFLSEKQKKDVGLSYAMNDYCARFGVETSAASALLKLFQDLITLSGQYLALGRRE